MRFSRIQPREVAAIELAAYPGILVSFDEYPELLSEELSGKWAKKLSFMAHEEEFDVVVGYVIAYRDESKFAPGRVIYVSDVAVSPGAQQSGVGFAIFAELLRRIEVMGIELDIELQAREATSLKAFRKESVQQALSRFGWSVEISDLSEKFTEDERTFWVRLIRNTKEVMAY